MNNDSTKDSGPLSVNSLIPPSRGVGAEDRENMERDGFVLPDGRNRRRKNRTQTISYNVKPQTKEAIHRMAETQGKSYVDVLEEAIVTYEKILQGKLRVVQPESESP